MLTETTTTSI